MFFKNYFNPFLGNSCYGIAIVYLNIFIYIFLLYILFSLIFLLDLRKIKTLNNLKVFSRYNFFTFSLVLLFLSLSGIPPLAGFVSKFLLFNFLFITQKYTYLITIVILNYFSLYFYMQNLRFIFSKSYVNHFLISGFYVYISKSLINILVLLNFINILGIFYISDVTYYFLNVVLHKNIF